jgi:hypothetical protein
MIARIHFLILILICNYSIGNGQITLDNSSNSGTNNGSSLTWSHTNTAGDFMVVSVTTKDKPLTSVTYNGTALTQAGVKVRNSMRVALYYMVAPATGAHNVVVTVSGGNTEIDAGAETYIGVDQASPVSGYVDASGQSSTATVNVTSATGDLVVDAAGPIQTTISVGAGQTQRHNRVGTNNANGSSTEAGAGTVTMSWTLASSKDWCICALSMKRNDPVPIELLNFNANQLGKQVKLDWQTATEINNDYFTIERTADGINFETLDTIDGAGNSIYTLSYYTFDEVPLKGVSYYHLKQVDFNGDFSFSQLRSVNFDGSEIILDSYPNPSVGEDIDITLSGFDGTADMLHIAIYDGLSRLIYQEESNVNPASVKQSVRVSLPDNTKDGMYYITVGYRNKIYHKTHLVKAYTAAY